MALKDFNVVINDLDGNPFPVPSSKEDEKDEIMNICWVAKNALVAVLPDESGLNPDRKAERFELAMRIVKGGKVDVTPEELVLIKELAGKIYGPLIVGQLYRWANA